MLLPAAGTDAAGIPNPWFQWSYLTGHTEAILTATRQHLTLTAVAVLAGLVLSLPLAVLARRYRWSAAPILTTTGVLYTIPALAAIVALVPFLGTRTALTVEIPLTAYTLLILVRNILVGLDGVPPEVREAARGMGFGAARLLWRVELPLALPAIIAGLRIATVSTIELATIGAYIGQGGYGTFIFEGFQNNFYRAEITTGVLLAVALAVTADLGLRAIQRLLSPWQRGRAGGAR